LSFATGSGLGIGLHPRSMGSGGRSFGCSSYTWGWWVWVCWYLLSCWSEGGGLADATTGGLYIGGSDMLHRHWLQCREGKGMFLLPGDYRQGRHAPLAPVKAHVSIRHALKLAVRDDDDSVCTLSDQRSNHLVERLICFRSSGMGWITTLIDSSTALQSLRPPVSTRCSSDLAYLGFLVAFAPSGVRTLSDDPDRPSPGPMPPNHPVFATPRRTMCLFEVVLQM
jgi:hypothetical protein